MLHLNSSELSNDSKSYLVSVLLDPDELLNLVTKRFVQHIKDLENYSPSDANTVQVRSIIDLLSKDVRLIFELNHAMIDLLKGFEVKVFSDEYLNFVNARLNSALRIFDGVKK